MVLAGTEEVYPDAACGDHLAAMIEQAYPSLPLGGRRVERSGGDHDLLIVDERFAFRFPRSGVRGLELEIAVLRQLQRRSAVATPSYSHVDPAGRFGGYPLITGSALTPARFRALPLTCREDILRTAASFLSELHRLSPESVAPIGDWPSTWAPAEFAKRGLAEFVSALGDRLPDEARAAAAFYARYGELELPASVVVHGDFVAEHVLLDDDTQQISGVIDFGDVALGDPAQDFLGFWALGADAAARAVELYQPAHADPALLDRSRCHFTRYCLDRLLEDADFRSTKLHDLATSIGELLAFDAFHNLRR